MTYIYPRLTRADVESEIARIERTIASGGNAQPFPDGGHHPGAIFPAAGTPVPAQHLRDLHEAVADAIPQASSRKRGDRDRLFDIAVGSALARWFESEGRAEASHPDIWPYLTLVVLPDLAVERFGPDTHGHLPHDRYRSGRRNVFQRLYLRSSILGELLSDPELPLFEDELVGLIDRNLSSDHRLARMVSAQIAALDRSTNRRETVRSGFKALQFELRVTDVAAMNDEALSTLLSGLFVPSND
ncbi:hypothetical protein [Microbacterium thalassium]|uniref:Uncharacterized protein n=1 Tax=Microbacterium thalassium TaxID=362649 RepID=A0A7X0FSG0_9MICO|nr:hypothetical protein [Microbacterium thalassium]MBB6392714.1 hypothetical protein [Microbacterium thalassium]